MTADLFNNAAAVAIDVPLLTAVCLPWILDLRVARISRTFQDLGYIYIYTHTYIQDAYIYIYTYRYLDIHIHLFMIIYRFKFLFFLVESFRIYTVCLCGPRDYAKISWEQCPRMAGPPA